MLQDSPQKYVETQTLVCCQTCRIVEEKVESTVKIQVSGEINTNVTLFKYKAAKQIYMVYMYGIQPSF